MFLLPKHQNDFYFKNGIASGFSLRIRSGIPSAYPVSMVAIFTSTLIYNYCGLSIYCVPFHHYLFFLWRVGDLNQLSLNLSSVFLSD